MDKYFLHTPTGYRYHQSSLVRMSKNFQLEINENVELPSFEIYLVKLEESPIKSPKSTEYDKYKQIAKETYDNYFQLSLKEVFNSKWEEAEYFLNINSPTWIEVIAFTQDKKNKFYIHIDLRDSIEGLCLDLTKGNSFSRKQGYKKNSSPIDEAMFMNALKETVKFFEDQNSYHINVENYLKRIKEIAEGNFSETKSEKTTNIDALINQLELKKKDITHRLIENDSDSENIRATLRGEKDGIEYSLRTIKKFFRSIS